MHVSLELRDRLLADVKLVIPDSYYARREDGDWRARLLLGSMVRGYLLSI